MKGVALIVILLALLVFGYLLMQRMQQPAVKVDFEDGKGTVEAPLVNLPNLATEKLEESMRKEAERIQKMQSEE